MLVKRFIVLVLVCFCKSFLQAQTITPQVINSGGDTKVNSAGIVLVDNIGEPFVQTVEGGDSQITQGFLQTYMAGSFSLSVLKSDVICFNANDGLISTAYTSSFPAYDTLRISYYYTPDTLCPTHDCSSVDSLAKGTYSLMVVVEHSQANVPNDTVRPGPITITDVNGPCLVKVFNWVTPNNDLVNDVFFIDHITEFPNNRVSIYNRWGALLYDRNNYDNVKEYWPKPENISTLASSTYFYIIELGDGSPAIKGWVEVFKN